MMKNWDRFRHFLEIQRCGSLKEAAKKLGVDPTTVGRNLSALEAEMGVRLFDRRSDGFVATEAGRRLSSSISGVEDTLIDSTRSVTGSDSKIEGTIRIAMPGALANHWLIPKLGKLLNDYPAIDLDFITGPEVVNLARREADLAIRMVRPKQTGLVVRRAGEIRIALYASKSLLKPNRKDSSWWELPFAGLAESATSEAEMDLLSSLPQRPSARIRSSAWSTVLSSVQGGYAVGVLPSVVVAEKTDLMQIPGTPVMSVPLWLVYHPDLKSSGRLRVLIEYIMALIE